MTPDEEISAMLIPLHGGLSIRFAGPDSRVMGRRICRGEGSKQLDGRVRRPSWNTATELSGTGMASI